MTDYLEGVHDQVKQAIKDSNTKYKTQFDSHKRKVTFEVGNLVWVVLTHDHFLVNKCNKLLERKVGRCEVLQKINANGYRLRLPSYLKSSHVFNAKHLTTYFVDADEDNVNSRASSFQPGKIDVVELADAKLLYSKLMALEYLDREDQCTNGKH
jgi:hypothetical protein